MGSVDIRFVFADTEDIYFSNHLLKLDFEQYFHLKLQNENFQNIYYFNKPKTNNEMVRLNCENYYELRRYCEKTKKSLFKKTADVPAYKKERMRTNSQRSMYVYEHPKKVFLENMASLTSISESCAFVFYIRSYSDIISLDDNLKINRILQKDKANNSRILFLIVVDENYTGPLPFFPEIVLSTEIVKRINISGNFDSLLMKLQTVNVDCETWQAFSVEQINRMIQRALLSSSETYDNSAIDVVSRLLYKRLVEDGKSTLFKLKVSDQNDLFQIFQDPEYMHKIMQHRIE